MAARHPLVGAAVGEDLWRRVVEAVPEGIWVVDGQGRTIFSNRRMADILGVPFESMPNQSCFACVFPDEADDARCNFARTFAGDPKPFDFRLRRADGSPIWVSISCRPMLGDSGAPVGLLGLFSDITERKRSEAALRESEERFHTLVDRAPVMTWTSGPDLTSTFFNAYALIFAGLSLPEAVGDGYLRVVHPEDRERYLAAIAEAAGARAPFSIETRFRRADSEYRWILITGVPRFLAGTYAGHIGTGVDITDLRNSYERNLASQKLQSLGVLAAGVAHDFNNLLGAIVTRAESALGDLDPASPALEDVAHIHQIGLRAAEIVAQLLTFSREEAGRPTALDLSAAVAEMVDLLKFSISKTAQLKADLASDLPPIQATAAEIRQLIMNLVINASDALEDKPGCIHITTARVPLDRNSSAVLMEVADTGCGMTAEVKARIFDPFFTTRANGHGLGLSAVRGIVRRHGGSIEVESTPGKGSRFAVTLPCSSDPAPPVALLAVPPAQGANPAGAVLLIEDEGALREPVARMLRRAGLTVIEASSGESGLELLQAGSSRIEVVLLDMTMPGMSGWEVLPQLRRLRPDLKVIVTSAHSLETVRSHMGGDLSWRYLRKPYRFADLMALLRAL